MSYLINKPKEIEVDPSNPFVNDALGRDKYANILTSVIEAYAQSGCVLAINGDWGSGKTTFVRMWKASLDNEGYKTIYFNAWESDYIDDPLIAFISELRELNANSDAFNKVLSNVGRILLSASSLAAKAIIKRFVSIDTDDIKGIIDETKDIGERYLNAYSEEKATFEDFKNNLINFVADNAGEKPIVFFVDELDRCRPDYAVKVLERIKHLFDISNIVFVLSINKKQLGHSIQGYYGTAFLDADDYLRRFIDLEYELPRPNMENYSDYLYKEFLFDDFLESPERLQYYRKGKEAQQLKSIASTLAEICQLDLRTQGRVFALCRITIQAMHSNNYLLPSVLYMLCLLKVKYSNIYSRIREKTYSVQDLLTAIENEVLEHLTTTDSSNNTILYTIALLIWNYNHPLHQDVVDSTFEGVQKGNSTEKSYAFAVNKLDKARLNELFNSIGTSHYNEYHIGLSFAIDRIDLLNPLIDDSLK